MKPPARYDHSEEVLDLDGEHVKTPTAGGDARNMTFRDLLVAAVHGQDKEERLSADVKDRCFQLSLKLCKGKHVRFTEAEKKLIMERAGAILLPFPFGRLQDWLDGLPQAVAGDDEEPDEDDDEGESVEQNAPAPRQKGKSKTPA